MNFKISARLTCTVPSSLAGAPMSLPAPRKYVSRSNPLAAMTSHSSPMTFSPSVVIFILVTGLNSRYRRSCGLAARK